MCLPCLCRVLLSLSLCRVVCLCCRVVCLCWAFYLSFCQVVCLCWVLCLPVSHVVCQCQLSISVDLSVSARLLVFVELSAEVCPVTTVVFLAISSESPVEKCLHFKRFNISRIPDQNGISQAYYILEIHNSGREPSIYCYGSGFWAWLFVLLFLFLCQMLIMRLCFLQFYICIV